MSSRYYLHSLDLPGNEADLAVTTIVHAETLKFLETTIDKFVHIITFDARGVPSLYVSFYSMDKDKAQFVIGNYHAYAAEHGLLLPFPPRSVTKPHTYF